MNIKYFVIQNTKCAALWNWWLLQKWKCHIPLSSVELRAWKAEQLRLMLTTGSLWPSDCWFCRRWRNAELTGLHGKNYAKFIMFWRPPGFGFSLVLFKSFWSAAMGFMVLILPLITTWIFKLSTSIMTLPSLLFYPADLKIFWKIN